MTGHLSIRAILVTCLLGTYACAPARTSNESSAADASVSTPGATVARSPTPLDHLRSLPAIAPHLDPTVMLARVASGYRLSGIAPASTGTSGRFALVESNRSVFTIPSRLGDPAHVGAMDEHGVESTWIEVTSDEVRGRLDAPTGLEAGAVTYRYALPDIDLVHVAEPGRIEELRIVHAAGDEIVTRHRITTSPSVRALRLDADMIEVVAANGTVVIKSDPIVAYDATGAGVPTTLDLQRVDDAWILTTRVATHGHRLPITIDPSWSLATSQPVYATAWRTASVAITQPNGRIRLVGDYAALDEFDPETNLWSAPPPVLINGTYKGTALSTDVSQGYDSFTWLPDGKGNVFAIGGNTYPTGITAGKTVLTVNATTGLLTALPDAPADISASAYVLAPTGKIYAFFGGNSGVGYSPTSYAFDPGTGVWTGLPTQLYGRIDHTATYLPSNGKILIAGGFGTGSSSVYVDAYLYDPVANAFTSIGPMPQSREYATAALLTSGPNNGKVLIVGSSTAYSPVTIAGTKYYENQTATLYDPVGNTFSTVQSPLPAPIWSAPYVTLSNGDLMFVGGLGTSTSVTRYSMSSNTFSAMTSLPVGLSSEWVAYLPGDRVLIGGGNNGPASNTHAYLYTPDAVTGTVGSSCTSGFAADGYCCNAPCTGTCEACNLPGFLGICTAVAGPIPAGHSGSCGVNLCGGAGPSGTGICATSCASDSGCATGNYCDTASSQCVPLLATGSGCTRGSECSSTLCVDGYCCGSACTGNCQACDVAGSAGICTNVASGNPHGTRVCGGTGTSALSSCESGACAPNPCSVDTDCVSGHYCVSGACVVALGQGSVCTANTQCQSGYCVDGVCCVGTKTDPSCSLPCNACNNAGSVGTCSAVPSGAPHTPKSCAPYTACGVATGACATGCSSAADCASGTAACVGGVCVGEKTNGASCSAGTECLSGNCVDGVCCNVACTGACQSCNLTGTVGTCSPVTGIADPHGICPTGPCAVLCNAGACGYKPAGTNCSATGPTCASGVLTNATCDGVSAPCGAAAAAPCAKNLACASSTACNTNCLVDTDCRSGFCDPSTNTCVSALDAGVDSGPPDLGAPDLGPPDLGAPDLGPPDLGAPDLGPVDAGAPDLGPPDVGAPDLGAPEAAPVDTGVAETSAPDAGKPDAIAETPAPAIAATPTVSGFTRCDKTSDCPSGLFCTEGVCCNTPCTDLCHSCALLTNPGQCTVEPIGVDLKNECGPGLACLGTCGPGAQCIGSGTGTMCARNRCTDSSHGVGPAFCASPGAPCTTDNVESFDCGPYACVPAFGACLTACGTSEDCAPTFVCDQGSKTCITPSSSPASGGCSVASTGRTEPGSDGFATFGLLSSLALFGARRRRSA